MLQGISLKNKVREKKREKKKNTGWPSFFEWGPIALFLKGTFIPCFIHRGKWKMQSHTKSAQTLHLFCLYQNQDHFCKPFPKTILCTLSSGLGGLWTFYDSLLIKATRPKNLFSLEMFFLIFLIYVSLKKYWTSYISHGAKVQWVTRKNQLAQKSDVVNFKATLVFLTFQLC